MQLRERNEALAQLVTQVGWCNVLWLGRTRPEPACLGRTCGFSLTQHCSEMFSIVLYGLLPCRLRRLKRLGGGIGSK